MTHRAVAALDDALARAGGEDVILRRPVGSGRSVQFVSVKCVARISAVTAEQISAGIAQTELNFIMSPTQIDRAQWPGGTVPQLPPFDVDQRIPRENVDQLIVRGKMRTVSFVDPVFAGAGELVRINGRIKG